MMSNRCENTPARACAQRWTGLRKSLRGACLIVLAAIVASGCKGVLIRDLMDDHKTAVSKAGTGDQQPFLGVLVEDGNHDASSGGVVIQHVLYGGPAEIAGIQADDLLTQLDAHTIRKPEHIATALAKAISRPGGDPDETANVQIEGRRILAHVVRGGEQVVATLLLSTAEKFCVRRNELMAAATADDRHAWTIPFVFDYASWHVPAPDWNHYTGSQASEEVTIYRDIDILPFFNLFSLCRIETASLFSGVRIQILTWPLVGSYVGEPQSRLHERPESDGKPVRVY